MLNKKDIDIVVSVYEQKGIVTRDDCPSLDSRPYAIEMYKELNGRYESVSIIESHLPGYIDYSSAIFNLREFTFDEVNKYMIENVLH